jgi:hypothetical protein
LLPTEPAKAVLQITARQSERPCAKGLINGYKWVRLPASVEEGLYQDWLEFYFPAAQAARRKCKLARSNSRPSHPLAQLVLAQSPIVTHCCCDEQSYVGSVAFLDCKFCRLTVESDLRIRTGSRLLSRLLTAQVRASFCGLQFHALVELPMGERIRLRLRSMTNPKAGPSIKFCIANYELIRNNRVKIARCVRVRGIAFAISWRRRCKYWKRPEVIDCVEECGFADAILEVVLWDWLTDDDATSSDTHGESPMGNRHLPFGAFVVPARSSTLEWKVKLQRCLSLTLTACPYLSLARGLLPVLGNATRFSLWQAFGK